MQKLQFPESLNSANWKALIASKQKKGSQTVELTLARSFYYLTLQANQRHALARLSAQYPATPYLLFLYHVAKQKIYSAAFYVALGLRNLLENEKMELPASAVR